MTHATELHPIDGGKRPSASAVRPSFPYEVADALSFLANLIDESIALRGVGDGVREWAAQHLGVRATEVASTFVDTGALRSQLLALAFCDDLASHPAVPMIGAEQTESPQWVTLDLGDTSVRVPCWLAAAFPADTIAAVPLVVRVTSPSNVPGLRFTVHARAEDVAAAEAYVADLRARSLERTNPFKNRTLETLYTRLGLTFKVLTPRRTSRADVVLPDRIWREVDRNVSGLFSALDRLAAAGLAQNRGVLLAGPPGTGKTALCRAVADELAGQVTVIFCDATAVKESVRELYKELKHLAPALVVMEDVDLVVGDRAHGSSGTLLDFLVALDGAMSDHRGVVTIATTNDARSIDAAAKRSARFDVLIEVPPPDEGGRAEILRRYLRDLDNDVDVARVAAATTGMSGADLRELVSDAVLHTATDVGSAVGGPVDTKLLVRLAVERRQRPAPGLYL